jgi:hypothetical protein
MAPKKKVAPKKIVPQKRGVKDPERGKDAEPKSPRAKMAQNRAQNKRQQGLVKDDYLYALEVSGQPASNRIRREFKRLAKKDMVYLEKKFPELKQEYGGGFMNRPHVKSIGKKKK